MTDTTTVEGQKSRAPRIPVSTRSHRAHEHSSSDLRVADGVCATRYHRLRKEHIIPIRCRRIGRSSHRHLRIQQLVPAHRHAELAYDLAPQYWGQGVMRRAVVAMLTWGFSEFGLNRVHAFVTTSNHRSIRLLARCGFSREGTRRQYRIARGEPKDFHPYALLAQDFACTARVASPNQAMQRTARRSDA